MVMSTLKEKNLPHSLWGEAVTTSVYIFNKCPTKKLKDKVPEEVWTGRKPLVKHLRMFGSLAYVHVPDEKRKKLNDKSAMMILIGYHPTGAYKLLNPTTRKVTYSRDVIIDETSQWNWNDKASNKSTTTPLLTDDYFETAETPADDPPVEEEQEEVQHSPQPVNMNNTPQRPKRTRHLPSKFADYELFASKGLHVNEDLTHFALLADAEPIDHDDALSKEVWRVAID